MPKEQGERGFYEQTQEVREWEKFRAREKVFDEIVSSGQVELGLYTGAKYTGSDKDIIVGDVVRYKIDDGYVEGIIVDSVDTCHNTLYCVKVRDFDGNETWGDFSALTLIRSYRSGDSDPGNNEVYDTDRFCPIVGGRCRDDCVMESEGFCMLTCALYKFNDVFIDTRSLGDFLHEIKRLW